MEKYDLGIIGGMGSEATVEIYRRIVERTYQSCDQEHMKIIILNNSVIPDRTKAILENGESPLPYLNNSIKDLEKLGAKNFIIACNTAHYFSSNFEINNINFINMIEETLKVIKKNYPNEKICLLSTKGTLKTKVYQENKEAKGLEFISLSDSNQDELMKIINDTKAAKDRTNLKIKLNNIIGEINKKEKNCLFLLACTELSTYKNDINDVKVLDAMDCLVDSAVTKCGYKLKKG